MDAQIPGFYDIYDPLVTSISRWWLLLPLVVLVMAVLLWWFRKKSKAEEQTLVSLWDQAMARLDSLTLPQTEDDVRLFYLSLTTLVKEYLERRYVVSLHEKTDDEVMAFLAHQSVVPFKIVEQVRFLCSRASHIKFSPEQGVIDAQADLERTKTIVRLSVPELSPIKGSLSV